MLPLRGQLCALAGASDLTARAGKYSASQPPRSLRDLAAGDLSLPTATFLRPFRAAPFAGQSAHMPNGGIEALRQMQDDLWGSTSDEDNALVSVFDSDDHLYTPDLSVDDEFLGSNSGKLFHVADPC